MLCKWELYPRKARKKGDGSIRFRLPLGMWDYSISQISFTNSRPRTTKIMPRIF